jgi:hypothetical protein
MCFRNPCQDLTVSFVLISTVITIPLILAFDELSISLFEFNLVIDCVFILV